jgi:hypothetical protein
MNHKLGFITAQLFLAESFNLKSELLKTLSFLYQELFIDLVFCLCKVENTFNRALQVDYEVTATAEWAKNLHSHVTVILLEFNC